MVRATRWAPLIAAWLLVGLTPPAATAAREVPVCRQRLPVATDGRLQLDRTSVRPGDHTLVVLSGFRQWPAGLVGGGSGETFLACAPWQPLGRAEVLAQPAAAVFVLSVPPRTAPGTYEVGVVFREGSRQPSGDGRLVRLVSRLTVASLPVPQPGTSPACVPRYPPAPAGVLVAPRTATAGSALRLAVTGIAPGRLATLEEGDRLWYVACLAGRATIVAGSATPPAGFCVRMPRWSTPGLYVIRVYGLLDGAAVSWQRSVRVPAAPVVAKPTVAPPARRTPSGRPTPSSSPGAAPAPSPSSASPTPSVTPTPRAAPAGERPSSGLPTAWALVAVGAVGLAAAGWLSAWVASGGSWRPPGRGGGR